MLLQALLKIQLNRHVNRHFKKIIMENKIERITKAATKSYIQDGYILQDYEFNEISQLAIYHIKHSNGNSIKIIGDIIYRKIYIYLNAKLNKTISL